MTFDLSDDAVFLLIGMLAAVGIQFLGQLSSQWINWSFGRKIGRDRAATECRAFSVDVFTLLRRSGRNTEDVLADYFELRRGLDSSIKIQYREELRQIDDLFWDLLDKREDTIYLENASYNEGLDSKEKMILSVLNRKDTH